MFCPFCWVICLSLPDVPVAPLALWVASKPEYPYRQRHRTIILCANSCFVMLKIKIGMKSSVSSENLQLDLKKSGQSVLHRPLVCSVKNLQVVTFIYEGGHNRVPQAERFEQQRFLFSQFRRPEVSDPGVIRAGFFWGSSCWLVDSPHLCVFTRSSLCVCLCPNLLFL